jgi:hypothetical protein
VPPLKGTPMPKRLRGRMGSDRKQCGRGRDISLVDCTDERPDGVDYVAFVEEKLTVWRSTKRELQNNLGSRAVPPTPSGPIRAEACIPDDLKPETLGY